MSAVVASAPKPRASGVAFRQGMRALPGAVTVVAANGATGEPIGLTATAVSSLSVDPPSLLVCVNRGSSIAAALVVGAHFSVNLLAAGQQDVADAFGGLRVARGVARFSYGGWFRGESEVPLLAGANVSFECVVAQVTDWATHHIVIGEVVDVHVAAAPAAPLIYHDGQYRSIG